MTEMETIGLLVGALLGDGIGLGVGLLIFEPDMEWTTKVILSIVVAVCAVALAGFIAYLARLEGAV